MDDDNMNKVSKMAGKASGLFFWIMVMGCLLPFIVICLGTLFTQ